MRRNARADRRRTRRGLAWNRVRSNGTCDVENGPDGLLLVGPCGGILESRQLFWGSPLEAHQYRGRAACTSAFFCVAVGSEMCDRGGRVGGRVFSGSHISPVRVGSRACREAASHGVLSRQDQARRLVPGLQRWFPPIQGQGLQSCRSARLPSKRACPEHALAELPVLSNRLSRRPPRMESLPRRLQEPDVGSRSFQGARSLRRVAHRP